VVRWTIVCEEEQGDRGLFRYRLTLKDNSLLEIFEFFIVTAAGVQVTKYRFHWQSASGQLQKRWDNAAHHPEIATYPHHVHDGTEENVLPHEPMNVEKVLSTIARSTNFRKTRLLSAIATRSDYANEGSLVPRFGDIRIQIGVLASAFNRCFICLPGQ
jgi:Family of unknown function (DUF6516)